MHCENSLLTRRICTSFTLECTVIRHSILINFTSLSCSNFPNLQYFRVEYFTNILNFASLPSVEVNIQDSTECFVYSKRPMHRNSMQERCPGCDNEKLVLGYVVPMENFTSAQRVFYVKDCMYIKIDLKVN